MGFRDVLHAMMNQKKSITQTTDNYFLRVVQFFRLPQTTEAIEVNHSKWRLFNKKI